MTSQGDGIAPAPSGNDNDDHIGLNASSLTDGDDDDLVDPPENPWMLALGGLAVLAIVAGILSVVSRHSTWTVVGVFILCSGVLMLTGYLVAGAITWQLRRR